MGDLFWLILTPVVVAYIGWRVRSYLADRDRYRAEEQRDREWDAAHEIGDAEATARAAGWIPLAEVLEALREMDPVEAALAGQHAWEDAARILAERFSDKEAT